MGQPEHTATIADHAPPTSSNGQATLVYDEKPAIEHVEGSPESEANLTYDDVDEEPELHARTYVAVAAMFMLNLVQVFALQGPPAVVRYMTVSALHV